MWFYISQGPVYSLTPIPITLKQSDTHILVYQTLYFFVVFVLIHRSFVDQCLNSFIAGARLK